MSAVKRAMTREAGVISSHLRVVPRIDPINLRCIPRDALNTANDRTTSAHEWVTTLNKAIKAYILIWLE
jgi:alpha-D-ribose 1-methylphosphonate 5-triphosphate synthase subunit PhnL